MADDKSRGGKKQAKEKQGPGKKHQGSTVTAKKGSASGGQRETRGRQTTRKK